MDDVAVIVVNWNTVADLRSCLTSLFSAPAPIISYSVIVVDNASSDDSPRMVREEFPQVQLLANETNVGFSRANNRAIRESRSRYVYLLNSDAAIYPGAIDELVAYADRCPQVGIVGSKVLNPNGTLQLSCRRFPTIGAGLFRNTYLGGLFPHNRFAQSYLMTEFDHMSTITVDWVSGCSMFIRREMIVRTGDLDERFFMYCEDVDICARAWQAGYEVAYLHTAVVTHAIGHSSNRAFERMNWAFHDALYELDKKRHPGFQPVRRPLVYMGLKLRATVRHAKHQVAKRKVKRMAKSAVAETAMPIGIESSEEGI